MVQKTTADRACSDAKYCNSASAALKEKTSAMPSSTMVSTVTPRSVDKPKISNDAAMAMAKALIGTIRPMAAGNTATPSTIARAAPKLAAAERPRVNGLASGFARTVCICAPASDRLAPTVTASRAMGIRMSQMTTRSWSSAAPGAMIVRTTSASAYRAGPSETSTATESTRSAASPARIISRRATSTR